MNAERERWIRSAQRKMLRWMLGSGRRKIETNCRAEPLETASDNSTDITEPSDGYDELEDPMLENW
eukprot:10479485-Karenia_brevis.AAC.1